MRRIIMTKMLAEESERGRVFVCEGCSDVHVRWDNWMFKLDQEAFGRLCQMLQDASRTLGFGSGRESAAAALFRHAAKLLQ